MKRLITIPVATLFIVFTAGLSCLIFSGTEKTYASFSNPYSERIRDIQLMLALKGMKVGANKETIPINGKLDSLTEEGIKSYQHQLNMPATGEVSEALYYGLFNDLQRQPFLIQPGVKEGDDQVIKTIFAELNNTKEELRNTKVALGSLTDNISNHFISNFREITSLIGVGLGIFAGLVGSFIVWGYIELQKDIKEKIKLGSELAHEQLLYKSKYRIYMSLSNAFYLYYRELFSNPTHAGYKSGIALALYFSEGALESAKALPEKEEDRLTFIKQAELHKLYHCASQSRIPKFPINKEEIVRQASQYKDFVEQLLDKGDERGIGCKETLAWVYKMLGNRDQQAEGERFLEEVLGYKNLTVGTKKEIEENYKNIRNDRQLTLPFSS